MSVVYINESPLLLEILSIEHRGDADDADEAALARTPSSAHAHHAPLSAAALAHAVLRPGDVLTGRVVVHARESEPVVGISVALRAALFWGSAGLAAAAANSASNSSASVAPVNDVTAAREAAFGRADGETLLRSVLVLLGAHHMAPAARARQLPTERLVRGTHVFPFQLQLPEGPPSTVLPSFVVEQLGAKVVYSLSAILERRDDGASNLVRPLPADAALLARSVSPTPSLLTRAIAQSSPAYPRPQRDANSRPSLASSASTPTPTRNAVYAAPPIVVVVDDATSTFSSLPPLPPADGGVADAPGRFLVPAPPANDVPAEGQYATNLLPHDDQYGVVTDPTNLAAPSAKGERGYATVPASVVAAPARERPYHAVTPLLDPDAEDSELYVPIGSQRELHDIPSASTSASPTVNWSGTMSSTQGALPAVPKVAAAAAAAAGQRDSDKRDSMRVSETVVVAGGDGKLPQVFHPPKSPRLANPQPTHGISGAHIAASVLLLRCIGARLPTPPRDWQPASASSLKKRLFSRKAMRLEISLQRSAFVVGQTLNVTIVSDDKKAGVLKLRRVVWVFDAANASSEATTCNTVTKIKVDETQPTSPRRKSEAASAAAGAAATDVATLKVLRSSAAAAPASPRSPRSPRGGGGDEEFVTTVALQLPLDMTPSCQSLNVRVSYQLHYLRKSRFRSDQTVSIAIKVLPN